MTILPDETASSLVFRLAQSRRQSVVSFCTQMFDLSVAQARSDLDRRLSSDHISRLAAVVSTPHRDLADIQLPKHFWYSVRNQRSRKYDGPVRVCPRCLAETKYGRRFWRTCFAAACPIHGVELSCTCHHCRNDLPYFGEMAGIVPQFWLESWPTCPNCLRLTEHITPAHPMLALMSRHWIAALAGHRQHAYQPTDFLRLSARTIQRFTTVNRYKQVAELIAPNSGWPGHVATAFLLHSLIQGRPPLSAAYAALGMEFQPVQLAKDIVV